MEKNLDLTEILKDAPKGTKFWSPICGECELAEVITYMNVIYPIKCVTKDSQGELENVVFTAYGEYTAHFANGKCVLFPSEQNYDWSTFKISKPHKHFEPFQKVLVSTKTPFNNVEWCAGIYSHYDELQEYHCTTESFCVLDDDIIPYSGNEDKLGKPVVES